MGIFNSLMGANNKLLTDSWLKLFAESSQIWYAAIFGQYLSIAMNIFSKVKCVGIFNSLTGANNKLLTDSWLKLFTDSYQIWYASIFGQYLRIAANIFFKK